jgi:predicted DNA-binding transcriptional regulator YafY
MSISGEWRQSLAEIEVEMHLLAGLAFAYQAKPEDNINQWLQDKPRVRQVIRRVSFTFWFTREVMQYTPDCVIMAPDNVRALVRDKITSLYQQYQLES